MPTSPSEDDLIQRLSAEPQPARAADDPIFLAMRAELDAIEVDLRTPPVDDPFADEPELAQTLANVQDLTHHSQAVTEDVDRSHPPAARTQPRQLGQYQLLEELGSGGMGTVYRAMHVKLGRVVALKVLPGDRFPTPDVVARFEREMRAAGLLQHPHIVAAHDAGEIDGHHFLVMELVDGIDVGQLQKRLGTLPIAEACEIVRQAALGLQHIHEHGLVHRDIKPSNLMLLKSKSGKPSTVKILDLGLALLEPLHVESGRELTSTGQVMGTVDYMAPEQGLDTHHVDIRADLYSLGATLYKLLTGRAPLEDPRFNTVMKRLIALDRETPPPLNSLRPDCPPALGELVQRLLSKSPEDRPAQPQLVADALMPFAAGADLQGLLDGTIGTPVPLTDAQRLEATFTNVSSQAPTSIDHPRPMMTSPRRTSRQTRWLLGLVLLPVVVLLAVVIHIATDNGRVTIEAPDDLTESVSVSVLRNGKTAVQGWQIKPGQNSHRVQTGNIELQLPAEISDAFELESPNDLTIRRNGTVQYRLTRRTTPTEAAMTPANTAISPPGPTRGFRGATAIPKPPPLEEWLKGRTILTVAQDGSGQFPTIQAALDALKPGQVVQVLDQGPYRESLRCENPPKDVGLVTNHKTVIEVAEWQAFRPDNSSFEYDVGMLIRNPDGFRLQGFHLVGTMALSERIAATLRVEGSQRLTIEDCRIECLGAETLETANASAVYLNGFQGDSLNPVVIQDCRLRRNLTINGWPGTVAPPLLIRRNYIEPSSPGYGMLVGGQVRQVFVLNNIIRCLAPSSGFIISPLPNGPAPEILELTHNTVIGQGVNRVLASVPPAVILRNNVLSAFQLSRGAEQQLEVVRGWQFANNWYSTRPESFPNATNLAFRRPEDPPVDVMFLSDDPESSEFGRVAAIDGAPAAGAVHPGPAPQDGDWFTRLRERWSDPKPVAARDANPPSAITEPPPLEEWLKGRTILTVAKDGSGQFQTIQAALDALQPGQVVRVLDRGPYQERLEVADLPSDSGLISTVQTIVEAPDWKYLYDADDGKGGQEPTYGAHVLNLPDGFRMHGFELRFAPHSYVSAKRLVTAATRDFTLENCYVHAQESFNGDHLDFGNWGDKLSSGMRVTIRDCVIEGSVAISGFEGRSEAVIARNEFRSRKNQHYLMLVGPNLSRIRLRENVFRSGSATSDDVAIIKAERCELVEVTNNTFGAEHSLVFSGSLPRETVTIRNNLDARSGVLLMTTNGGEKQQSLIATRWNIDHNTARKLPDGVSSNAVPHQPGDFDKIPRLLSKDPQSPDYLRIAADDPLANAGAGGGWPTYIGALPPGPVSKDGDWFSRLRERWSNPKPVAARDANPPSAITEPPPLEEWLKGRTILTVAQDGSGQFKTIQAALDSLKPHQVIQVLDVGPYRERISSGGLPHDTGLITLKQTILDVGDSPAVFGPLDGFRFSGFRVVGLPVKEYRSLLLINRASALVLEDCAFALTDASTESLRTGVAFEGAEPDSRPSIIRHCLFDNQSSGISVNNAFEPVPELFVLRNDFTSGGTSVAVTGPQIERLVVRNNIFRSGSIWIGGLARITKDFEISNNTVVQFKVCGFESNLPLSGMTIHNNLSEIADVNSDEPTTQILKSGKFVWKMDYNSYVRRGQLPKAEHDVIADPQFLSTNPADRDFLRVPLESALATGGAGGEWPAYIGALAPGPAPQDGDWFTRLRERWGD